MSLLLAILIGYACIQLWRYIDNYKSSDTRPSMQNANRETPTTPSLPYQYRRKCLMTNTEKQYYKAIRDCLGADYIVQPQVNLASILEKVGEFRYQNELYRNIDFGVFDSNFNILLLIEINDATHREKRRIERDAKVKAITENAKVPLIIYYTSYGVNYDYIQRTLYAALEVKYTNSTEMNNNEHKENTNTP